MKKYLKPKIKVILSEKICCTTESKQQNRHCSPCESKYSDLSYDNLWDF